MLKGLLETLRSFIFEKPVTVQYPEEKRPVSHSLPWPSRFEAL